jgi:hypothetical protein
LQRGYPIGIDIIRHNASAIRDKASRDRKSNARCTTGDNCGLPGKPSVCHVYSCIHHMREAARPNKL